MSANKHILALINKLVGSAMVLDQASSFDLLKELGGNYLHLYDDPAIESEKSVILQGTRLENDLAEIQAAIADKVKLISESTILKTTRTLLYENSLKESTVNGKYLSSIIQNLKTDFPIQSFTIILPIYGIRITTENPLILGSNQVILLSSVIHRTKLEAVHPGLFQNHKGLFWQHTNTDTLLVIELEARDSEKAKKLAQRKVQDVIFTMKFILGIDSEIYHIDTEPENRKLLPAIVLLDGQMSTGFTYEPSKNALDITPLVQGKFKSLWQVILKDRKSKLETRIYNSVVWIGKALSDTDSARSFLQLIISLESLLQYNPGDQIRPGIQHSIAEAVAFLLEGQSDSRSSLFEQLKKYYRARSGIVHGGKTTVLESDRKALVKVLRRLNFFCIENKNELKTIENIYSFINDKKFS